MTNALERLLTRYEELVGRAYRGTLELTTQAEKYEADLRLAMDVRAIEQRGEAEAVGCRYPVHGSVTHVRSVECCDFCGNPAGTTPPEPVAEIERLREALGKLELSENGLSLRTPYDGDVDGDGRHIVVGGEVVVTFSDCTLGETIREALLEFLPPASRAALGGAS